MRAKEFTSTPIVWLFNRDQVVTVFINDVHVTVATTLGQTVSFPRSGVNVDELVDEFSNTVNSNFARVSWCSGAADDVNVENRL